MATHTYHDVRCVYSEGNQLCAGVGEGVEECDSGGGGEEGDDLVRRWGVRGGKRFLLCGTSLVCVGGREGGWKGEVAGGGGGGRRGWREEGAEGGEGGGRKREERWREEGEERWREEGVEGGGGRREGGGGGRREVERGGVKGGGRRWREEGVEGGRRAWREGWRTVEGGTRQTSSTVPR